MAGVNALARAIAKALAKGQVKKAARLEADDQTRRTLWKAIEEKALSQINPAYISELGPEDYGLPGKKILLRAGYDEKRAAALALRLHLKAWREMSTALRENAAQPLPKIVTPRLKDQPSATASLPILRREQAPDDIREFLLKQYPNAKAGDIIEHEGRLYMRSTAVGSKGGTSNFLHLVRRDTPYYSPYAD